MYQHGEMMVDITAEHALNTKPTPTPPQFENAVISRAAPFTHCVSSCQLPMAVFPVAGLSEDGTAMIGRSRGRAPADSNGGNCAPEKNTESAKKPHYGLERVLS
jgi:hypothetical protein